jgi:hypothetical protein
VPDVAIGAGLLIKKTVAAVAAAKVRKTSEPVVMVGAVPDYSRWLQVDRVI